MVTVLYARPRKPVLTSERREQLHRRLQVTSAFIHFLDVLIRHLSTAQNFYRRIGDRLSATPLVRLIRSVRFWFTLRPTLLRRKLEAYNGQIQELLIVRHGGQIVSSPQAGLPWTTTTACSPIWDGRLDIERDNNSVGLENEGETNSKVYPFPTAQSPEEVPVVEALKTIVGELVAIEDLTDDLRQKVGPPPIPSDAAKFTINPPLSEMPFGSDPSQDASPTRYDYVIVPITVKSPPKKPVKRRTTKKPRTGKKK